MKYDEMYGLFLPVVGLPFALLLEYSLTVHHSVPVSVCISQQCFRFV